MTESIVHVLCGPVGSGKTTLAQTLEASGQVVRFSIDEWMTHLYDEAMSRETFDARWHLCMELSLRLAARLVGLGVSVVLDFGLWRRAQRRAVLVRIAAWGASTQLYYCDVPADIRWTRLCARNAALLEGTFEITREMFELFDSWFEPPDPAEGFIRVGAEGRVPDAV